jgi:hypothetical protein
MKMVKMGWHHRQIPSPLAITMPASPYNAIGAKMVHMHAWYKFASARQRVALFVIPSSLDVGT